MIGSPGNSVGVAIFVVIVSIACWYLYLRPNQEKTKSSTSASNQRNGTSKSSSTSAPSSDGGFLKNVWDAPRNPISLPKGNGKGGKEKPFGSKYYYAHNNPNATGGYKDGLRMEDYVMNGPRLLSRNGQKVDPSANTTVQDPASNPTSSDQEKEGASKSQGSSVNPPNSQSTISSTSKPPIPITKYLWDDPGNSNGVATIRVDRLPETCSPISPLREWRKENIAQVTAHLVGEGLVVTILEDQQENDSSAETSNSVSSDSYPKTYQLKIHKLYGDVSKVETVTKAKRLLIQLHKKKISVLAKPTGGKSNMDAWPQPYRKI
eukprot:Nitzschia sp. Nitz4//scaffold115_size69933//58940//59899//NITZ4_006011-RA/size69933-processed-gene-0.113-mRNA-1//1//CDS//3329533526//4513//frame0